MLLKRYLVLWFWIWFMFPSIWSVFKLLLVIWEVCAGVWGDTPSLRHYLHLTHTLHTSSTEENTAVLFMLISEALLPLRHVFFALYKNTGIQFTCMNQDLLKPEKHLNTQTLEWFEEDRELWQVGWAWFSSGLSHLSRDSSGPAASPCPPPASRSSVWWASPLRSYCIAPGSLACDAWRWRGQAYCRGNDRSERYTYNSHSLWYGTLLTYNNELIQLIGCMSFG